ncbi:MAG: response regulator transcription factor [Bacteroidia bacterium]|nr:response regulator transcription factor [Bacteroidia bacterium]
MTLTPAHILLAEDDPTLGYLLSEYLKLKGFAVTWLQDGSKVLEQVGLLRPDLCILDVMMPTMDGFQVAQLLVDNHPHIPFMFLTAKSMKIDVLKGFQVGAVDYVKKPVDEEELLARIHAILQRKLPATTLINGIPIGEYQFFPARQELSHQGEIKSLTRRESDLLKILCEHRGELVESSDLLLQLWGKDDFFARKSMDVYLHKLRKYLASDPRVEIVNVHGRGFFLQET